MSIEARVTAPRTTEPRAALGPHEAAPAVTMLDVADDDEVEPVDDPEEPEVVVELEPYTPGKGKKIKLANEVLVENEHASARKKEIAYQQHQWLRSPKQKYRSQRQRQSWWQWRSQK